MSTTTAVTAPKNPIPDWEKVRDEWLSRLSALVQSIESWAQELGWSTRRIEKRMEEDTEIGMYLAPALLLQEEFTRVLLDPIARVTLGSDGVVDLYRMPMYDDIAHIYFSEGGWLLEYANPEMSRSKIKGEVAPKPVSKETVTEVLDELKKHAS